VSGSGKSFGPIGWWHMSLEEEGAGDVIECPYGAFGLAVLLRCIGTGEA
jgi:hypothetical protein